MTVTSAPASSLSDFDRCPRLPKLLAELSPTRLPIRAATRRAFADGLAAIAAASQSDYTDAIDAQLAAFLAAASSPGYLYPPGEPYVIAQDHAAWLTGALALAAESTPFTSLVKPAAPYTLGDRSLDLGAWRDLLDDSIHVYRASERMDRRPRWPEQLAAAFEPSTTVWVHCLRLPRVNTLGRLPSPLSLGYAHPMTGQIRLAKFERDRLRGQARGSSNFHSSWKRVGRWERPDIPWVEWRRGIDADECLDTCEQRWRSTARSDGQTLQDARRILREIEWSGMPPRRWETCTGCIYEGWCHGTEEERGEYVRIESVESVGDDHQAMQRMSQTETSGAVHSGPRPD